MLTLLKCINSDLTHVHWMLDILLINVTLTVSCNRSITKVSLNKYYSLASSHNFFYRYIQSDFFFCIMLLLINLHVQILKPLQVY